MTIGQVNHTTGLLTVLHAAVDGLCACCLFAVEPILGPVGVTSLFVAYNVLAFMTQPLVGLYIDRRPQGTSLLLMALVLLTSGCLLTLLLSDADVWMLALPVVLLGVGNSLFHVYGGKRVAVLSGNDLRHLGIFVSSGALGLFLGRMWAGPIAAVVIVSLLLIAGIGVILCQKEVSQKLQNLTISADYGIDFAKKRRFWLILLLICVVFVRSFFGQLEPYISFSMPIFALILAVFGKAFGGFLARKWGVWRLLVLLLMVSGVCFLMSYYDAVFVLLMALCLNLTMPLTLGLANRALPGREGLAFGLLAFVLAPGVCLATMCSGNELVYLLLFALVATIVVETLVLLLFGERRWQVLGISLVMNVLTNIPLNLLVLTHFDGDIPMGWALLLELLIFVVESLLYLAVMRDVKRSFLYGFVCNLVSYLAGLAFGLICT